MADKYLGKAQWHMVKQEFELAANCLKVACKKGSAEAFHKLAVLYCCGLLGNFNYQEGVKHAAMAALKGRRGANDILSYCYLHGYGVRKDLNLAGYYSELGSKLQHTSYLERKGDVEAANKHVDRTLKVFPKDRCSLNHQAVYYMTKEPNQAKAKKLFLLAATPDKDGITFENAYNYFVNDEGEYGLVVYHSSAGNMDAQRNLANLLHREGNTAHSCYWNIQAANNGSKVAVCVLARWPFRPHLRKAVQHAFRLLKVARVVLHDTAFLNWSLKQSVLSYIAPKDTFHPEQLRLILRYAEDISTLGQSQGQFLQFVHLKVTRRTAIPEDKSPKIKSC